MGRLFANYDNKITQGYKKGRHNGIDLVGKGENNASCLDYLVAHSDGEVVAVRSDCNKTYKVGNSYGNYVKIKHPNGMYTLYSHIKYGWVKVKKGDKVYKGQIIGYMGNTGHSFGAHLHFEVFDANNNKIDPTPYIDADLPTEKEQKKEEKKLINKLQYARSKDVTVKKGQTLRTTDALNLRYGAGSDKYASMVVMPKGTKVKWYGYYTEYKGIRWYYVIATVLGKRYTGFCSSEYLE